VAAGLVINSAFYQGRSLAVALVGIGNMHAIATKKRAPARGCPYDFAGEIGLVEIDRWW
jgi:hypothetical protein